MAVPRLGAVSVVAATFSAGAPAKMPVFVAVAIPVMIFLIVVFAGILPMTVAVGAPHRVGLWAARPVLALAWLLTPLRTLLATY